MTGRVAGKVVVVPPGIRHLQAVRDEVVSALHLNVEHLGVARQLDGSNRVNSTLVGTRQQPEAVRR